MSDFDQDDIAAMRRENGGEDLRRFMRQQIAEGKARRQQPAEKPARRPTGRPPGSWPTGISPAPSQSPQHSASAWTEALDDYRRWLLTTNHPERIDENQTCGCPGCQALTRKDPS
ncbi:hypothetical protein [Streptomyces cinereoruber]|uniref:hypothetical protein n=1 Tax=Streptomyces cinereoruber TaxID=67260 RepID=UPI003633ADFA